MDEPSGSCPVLTAWIKLDAVVQRVASKEVMLDASGKLTRQSVADNADILKPVIETLGDLTGQVQSCNTVIECYAFDVLPCYTCSIDIYP